MGTKLGHTATAALVALLVGLTAIGGLPGRAVAVGGAEAQLLDGMNSARSANGLAPLTADGELAGLARRWADRMRSDYEGSGDASSAVRHNPSVFEQIPHRYTRAAENVGYSADGRASTAALADKILDGFMASSGHRGNILGRFTVAGVGLSQASDGALFATVVFTDGDRPDSGEEAEPEPESRSGAPAPSRDERPEPQPQPRPEPESAPEPEPAPDPPSPPEPPSGEELFGAGWPDGYLVSGPWALRPRVLLSVPGTLHEFRLGLGIPSRMPSYMRGRP